MLELALNEQVKERSKGKINAAQILLSIAGIALALWAGFGFVDYFVRRADWRERLRLLREEPGIVVVESTVIDNRFLVTGLRDPESRTPEEIFAEAGINVSPDNCRLNLLPFFSNVPEFVERRARSFLDAPDTVQFDLDEDGDLRVTGQATAEWEARLRAAPTVMLGVMSYSIDLETIDSDE